MADIEYREVIVDGDPVPKPGFRNVIVKRSAYVIADSENPGDLIANAAGVVPYYLIFDGRLFRLDADDTTSGPPDNQTLIVTQDGYRYFSDGLVGPIWLLLEANRNDPPGSPSVGDSYHTGPAPTGDWAGHPNIIATWTRRGWVFSDIPVGRAIYVESDKSFRHMDENGVFKLGLGVATIGDNSIRDTMLIGGPRRYIVQNQTTNDPPTPTIGVYYIVGPAPTGDWANHTGEIATSYDGSTWTLITPQSGDEAFDLGRGVNHIFITGDGWSPDGGKVTQFDNGTFTWTKDPVIGASPTGRARIMVWGSGGNPNYQGASSGKGGAYKEWDVELSVLGTTETVVAGPPGSGNTNADSKGTDSSFGSWIVAQAGSYYTQGGDSSSGATPLGAITESGSDGRNSNGNASSRQRAGPGGGYGASGVGGQGLQLDNDGGSAGVLGWNGVEGSGHAPGGGGAYLSGSPANVRGAPGRVIVIEYRL